MTRPTCNRATFHLWLFRAAALFVLLYLSGCAENPVTGKQELWLISEQEEIAMGVENYVPLQQISGGLYTVDEPLSKYVNSVGQKLAKVSDRPLPYEFVVVNDSIPNAWALPGGKIAINRGLLQELNSEAELAAVLGHEIVHAAARHTAKNMQRDLLMGVGLIVLGAAVADNEHGDWILGGAQIGSALLGLKYSRDAESEADYYGMIYMSRAGYDPRAAIQLQETFVRLSEGHNTNWLEGLLSTHPPSQERVEANRRTAATLPNQGMYVGDGVYKKEIANLLKTAPAYAAYDQGREAFEKGQTKKSMELAKKAVTGQPREALFYGLIGDIYEEQGKSNAAVNAYNKAIDRNDEFFYFYLKRGLLKLDQGNTSAAQRDLEHSNKFLPTAKAHYELGNLALRSGNRHEAIQHYEWAAGADDNTGRQASVALAKLVLPDSPDRYIKASPYLTKDGFIAVKLSNQAPIAINRMEVVVYAQGQRFVYLARNLRPSGNTHINTNIFVPVNNRGNVNAQVVLQSIQVD